MRYKAKPRVSKAITNKEDLEYILNLTEDDLMHTHVIMDMFADFTGEDKPRFHTYDTITIPPGYYEIEPGKKNKKPCVTTVGIWIFNKLFIEPNFNHLFGYINEEITAGKFGDINDEISYALLEDETTVDALSDFIQKGQYFMKFASVLSPSASTALTINEKINKKKIELVNANKEAIKNGDAEVVTEIEKELIDYAKELLKDDPSYDVFASGAGPDWKNNFKSMFVSKGAIINPIPGMGYDIIMSSFMDSINKEDYIVLANALSAGPYSRSNKTAMGGYWELLVLHATEHVTLGEPGSDCGTKRTITVTLDKATLKDFMYSYIVDNGKLVELNRKNKDKYLGKTVNIRYSAMCEMKSSGGKTCKCNKCIGNLPYRIKTDREGTKYIHNIGAATPQLMSRIKNINMKAFHESLTTFVEMDPMDAFES